MKVSHSFNHCSTQFSAASVSSVLHTPCKQQLLVCAHKQVKCPSSDSRGIMLNRPTWQLAQMSLAESAWLLMLSCRKLWQHWCMRLRFKCENIGVILQSDVWSLGCVLYEMATLRHPFDAPNMRQLATKVCVCVCVHVLPFARACTGMSITLHVPSLPYLATSEGKLCAYSHYLL